MSQAARGTYGVVGIEASEFLITRVATLAV